MSAPFDATNRKEARPHDLKESQEQVADKGQLWRFEGGSGKEERQEGLPDYWIGSQPR